MTSSRALKPSLVIGCDRGKRVELVKRFLGRGLRGDVWPHWQEGKKKTLLPKVKPDMTYSFDFSIKQHLRSNYNRRARKLLSQISNATNRATSKVNDWIRQIEQVRLGRFFLSKSIGKSWFLNQIDKKEVHCFGQKSSWQLLLKKRKKEKNSCFRLELGFEFQLLHFFCIASPFGLTGVLSCLWSVGSLSHDQTPSRRW